MFISFEGIEGSGKTTLIGRLSRWLEEKGENPLATREPGEGYLGKRLRKLLLDAELPPVCPNAELFLFLADRAQHVNDVILPALKQKRPVLCDRYTESTLAYQGGGRGMDMAMLSTLCETASCGLRPDAIILLDLPVETGLERVKKRMTEGQLKAESRFDLETVRFHERVRATYLSLARQNPDIKIIDGSQTPEQVFRRCLKALNLE